MTPAERTALRQCYHFCCGYCGVSETDVGSEHITTQEDSTLLGLTETGRFHIQHLRLNRPALVAHRLQLQQREREAQRHTEILRSLAEVQQELRLLRQRLEQQLREGA